MSLALCPDCGHEVSTVAPACTNCGRPFPPPAAARNVVVAPREDSFPPWAIALMAVGGILVLLIAFLIFRQGDDQANSNLSVNVNSRRPSTTTERDTATTTTVPPSAPQSVSVPPSSSVPGQTTTVPGTSTSVPSAPPPDKGSVTINAKITTSTGGSRAASGTKFYLLDKDVESILSEARVEPIDGNSLAGSLGLAAVFPDRYGDFQRAAMRAIARHVKYSGTTSAAGNTGLKSVEPDSYYLFAISRVGRGFALWNSPVSVIPGDNVMNLSPQSITEINDPNG